MTTITIKIVKIERYTNKALVMHYNAYKNPIIKLINYNLRIRSKTNNYVISKLKGHYIQEFISQKYQFATC